MPRCERRGEMSMLMVRACKRVESELLGGNCARTFDRVSIYTSPSSIKEKEKVGQLSQMRSLKRSLSIRAKVSLARVAESVR